MRTVITRTLIEVARSHGVDCWWVTTLLLQCTKGGDLTADEATDIPYDLVDEGMKIYPKSTCRYGRSSANEKTEFEYSTGLGSAFGQRAQQPEG